MTISNIKSKILIFIFTILSIGYIMYGIDGIANKNSINPDDFIMRYRESKYTLGGVNPFLVMKGEALTDDNIGTLWEHGGTAPWALGMGIIFNFTFLTENVARIMVILVIYLVYIITLYNVYKFGERTGLNRVQICLLVMGVCALPGWGTGISYLNYGCALSGLLIIGILNKEKRPILFYLSIALSSMKPQLALPFYLALLYKKEWKGLLISCSIPLLGWVMTCILTNTGPLKFLSDMALNGGNYDSNSLYRMIQNFIYTGYSQKMADVISFILCAGLMLYFWNKINKLKLKNDNLIFYSVPAIFCGMWMYMQEHDRTIMGLAVILYLLFIIRTDYKIFSKTIITAIIFTIIMPSVFQSQWCSLINKDGIFSINIFILVKYCLQIVGLIIIVNNIELKK